MHLESLNEMQQTTSDVILNTDDNLMILSPTGTGKTLAYLLPLCQRLDPEINAVQVIVVVPGRELALQSSAVLKDMGTGLRSCACYGGRATMDEHRVLRQVQPHIIFGTPGRLNDHLDKGNFPIDNLEYIVIDEFDKCLEMGFQVEMQNLISRLPQGTRQILLSATPAEEMKDQRIFNPRFTTLNYISNAGQIPNRVEIYTVHSPEKDKLTTLRKLLLHLGEAQSIVFLNYRESVERVSKYLQEEGFGISCFHGGLEQRQREAALYKFSNGSANILVSTDLASRGLDIPNIANIIHYHLPEAEENYIHRVGRSARWDAKGNSFFILGPEESLPDYVNADVSPFVILDNNRTVPVPKMSTLYIGKGKKDKLSKGDIVGFLCKRARLQGSEIGHIDIKDYYSYVAIPKTKFKEVLNLTNGQKIKGIKTIFEEVR
ncbi:DbpA RNA binding domain-containing protein [Prevotella sp. KH2C16]|nr:DbpA RNA binding domain-containing protein [Prevotella sp. KH2C16]